MKVKHRNATFGFTLIELLVTIAIIAILIGIVAGVASIANRKSSESQARTGMQAIANALEDYRARYGKYPSESYFDQGNLTGQDGNPLSLVDPWGRLFEYSVGNNGLIFELKSVGMLANDAADDISYSMEGL